MLFHDYEEYKNKYLETQKKYEEILSEKEELFARTQPKAVRFDVERVAGGKQERTFETYLIDKERKRIEERLAEIKSLLADRERLLAVKKEELYASDEVFDKIYRLRYVESIRAYKIAELIKYSPSQVYRILGQIDASIEKMRQNATKAMLEL